MFPTLYADRYHENRRLLCFTSEDILSGDKAEVNMKNEGNDSVSAFLMRRKDINKASIDVATDSPGFFTPAWSHFDGKVSVQFRVISNS